MFGLVLRALSLAALLASLVEGAEAPSVQLPRYVAVATMTNNVPDFPAMISGWCNQAEPNKLQCTFAQVRFLNLKDDEPRLWLTVFRQTFTRTSATGQWVSREGPQGVCGLVDVSTLEADPRGAEVLWSYTSRQIYTNKTGPLCDKLYGEEKETFSWKNAPVTIGGKKFRQLAVNFPEIP